MHFMLKIWFGFSKKDWDCMGRLVQCDFLSNKFAPAEERKYSTHIPNSKNKGIRGILYISGLEL
jgi:hypothetical protein